MIIIPYKAVGNLFFLDDREEIRKKINEEYTSGSKGDGDLKETYDYFEKSELFVYYDDESHVNAFEFFRPNPIFDSTDLMSIHYSDLVNLFLELDQDLINGYDDFTSIKYGIGGNTTQDPDEPDSYPEAIIIFKRGYYDLLNY